MRNDPSKIVPTSESTADSWVNWHKSLKRWFNKGEANTQWLRFWQQRAGAGSEADRHSLRLYMKKQGVELSTNTINELRDVGEGVIDWFSTTINTTKFIILGSAIVGLGLIAVYVINSSRRGKSIGEMAVDVKRLGKGAGR